MASSWGFCRRTRVGLPCRCCRLEAGHNDFLHRLGQHLWHFSVDKDPALLNWPSRETPERACDFHSPSHYAKYCSHECRVAEGQSGCLSLWRVEGDTFSKWSSQGSKHSGSYAGKSVCSTTPPMATFQCFHQCRSSKGSSLKVNTYCDLSRNAHSHLNPLRISGCHLHCPFLKTFQYGRMMRGLLWICTYQDDSGHWSNF